MNKAHRVRTRKFRSVFPGAIALLLVLCLTLPCSRAQAPSDTTKEVFLTAITAEGKYNKYWVRRDKLPSTVTWCPEGDRLPINIASEIQRAGSFIVDKNGITNAIAITEICIQRVRMS